jgi:hypothetical protein
MRGTVESAYTTVGSGCAAKGKRGAVWAVKRGPAAAKRSKRIRIAKKEREVRRMGERYEGVGVKLKVLPGAGRIFGVRTV